MQNHKMTTTGIEPATFLLVAQGGVRTRYSCHIIMKVKFVSIDVRKILKYQIS